MLLDARQRFVRGGCLRDDLETGVGQDPRDTGRITAESSATITRTG